MLMQTKYTDGDRHLLDVARAVREGKVENFSMERFFHTGYAKGFSCGTPACALGHYVAREDLQQEFAQDGICIMYADGEWGRYGDYGIAFTDKRFLNYFGLANGHEADLLFERTGCGNAKTPEAAAEFIENFVAARVAARV